MKALNWLDGRIAQSSSASSIYNRVPNGGTVRRDYRILFDSDQIEHWEQQKRLCRYLTGFLLILFGLCVAARFVGPINDWLSGPAQPLQAIAQQMAKVTANATAHQYPILVVRDEHQSCQDAQRSTSDDYDMVLYVLAFSEQKRSLCITTYVHFSNGVLLPNTTTLNESMGHNYGSSLPRPVEAVPIENRLTTYPERYLALLHWRTEVHFPLSNADQLSAHTRQYAPNGAAGSLGLDLGFQDLRAAVAQRHNTVNRVLSVTLSCISVLLVAFTGSSWFVFRRVQQHFHQPGVAITIAAFLFSDLRRIARDAQRQYFEYQESVDHAFVMSATAAFRCRQKAPAQLFGVH